MSAWFVETRLAWIKESVEIFGFINREHIMKKFGISTPQASVDIREALKRWPDLMSYDKSAKQYVSQTAIIKIPEIRDPHIYGLAHDPADQSRDDDRRFEKLSKEMHAKLPENYSAPLDRRHTRELIGERRGAGSPNPRRIPED